MTTTTALLLAGPLLVMLFLVSLAAASLRGFSRSRLDVLCREQGLEALFFEVLKNRDRTLIAVEIIQFVLIVSLSVHVIAWSEIQRSDQTVSETQVLAILALSGTVFTVVLLAFGLIFPGALARVSGEAFLIRVWPVLLILSALMRPIVLLSEAIDALLHRLFGVPQRRADDPQTVSDEIRSVVEAGRRMGVIKPLASSMISQVMGLTDSDVGAVMTPRTRMCCLRKGMTMNEAREAILDAGHTRMPLIGQSTDDIQGIIYAKDVLRYIGVPETEAPPLSSICREAFYVPETTSIDHLLESMNRKRVHLAIVLDEYGGVAGLVTMEDLLEEIVGEIVDEYDDVEADPIQRLSETVNEVDARVRVDDLMAQFQYDLPEERDYDTIAGFVFSHLGRVPGRGEQLEYGHLRITVLDADPRRIKRLRLERDLTLMPAGHEEE